MSSDLWFIINQMIIEKSVKTLKETFGNPTISELKERIVGKTKDESDDEDKK